VSLDLYFRRTLTLKSIFRLGLLKMFAVEYFGGDRTTHIKLFFYLFICFRYSTIERGNQVFISHSKYKRVALFRVLYRIQAYIGLVMNLLKCLIQLAVIIKCAFILSINVSFFDYRVWMFSLTHGFSGFCL